MQICYGWPTLSIFNKFVTTNELNNKIEDQQKQIEDQQKQIEDQQKQIEDQQKYSIILGFLIIILIIINIINFYKNLISITLYFEG